LGLIHRSQPRTFEEDLTKRVGGPLYEILFKPIAVKLWGNPKGLDVKLSHGRVQTPSIFEVVKQTLGFRRTSSFEALTFRYPAGGLSELWRAIRRKTETSGNYHLGQTVIGFEVSGNRITELRCKALDGSFSTLQVGSSDFVVSSLPLGIAVRLLGRAIPDKVATLTEQTIILNDLLLVFLHLDQSKLFPQAWVFVPDPGVAFHRISEQESFDPAMTPNGTIVCCEIMSNEMRNMASLSDAELIQAAVQGLSAMGYHGMRILDSRVVRLPKSYPVFRPGFESALSEILGHIDRIENFRTVGRQGAFNYIGTLDAMDIGYGFVRWFQAGQRDGLWKDERQRTDHYPVLD